MRLPFSVCNQGRGNNMFCSIECLKAYDKNHGKPLFNEGDWSEKETNIKETHHTRFNTRNLFDRKHFQKMWGQLHDPWGRYAQTWCLVRSMGWIRWRCVCFFKVPVPFSCSVSCCRYIKCSIHELTTITVWLKIMVLDIGILHSFCSLLLFDVISRWYCLRLQFCSYLLFQLYENRTRKSIVTFAIKQSTRTKPHSKKTNHTHTHTHTDGCRTELRVYVLGWLWSLLTKAFNASSV